MTLVPDAATRRAVLAHTVATAVADAALHGVVLIVGDRGQAAGAAVAWPPGYHPGTALRPRELMAGARILAEAPSAAWTLWRRWRAMRGADPADVHWHLAGVGVRPEAQRGGIGSALVDAFVARADRTGSAAYLETARPELVPWYASTGFSVRSTLDVPGGRTVWTMWRAAREAGAAERPRTAADGRRDPLTTRMS